MDNSNIQSNSLWEEKNLIELKTKSCNETEKNLNDTMTEIEKQSVKKECNDISPQKISGIYKIVNKINGKYYVGSSKNIIKSRWKKHKYFVKNNKHWNVKFQNAWNKYGEDNFEWIIIETVNENQLLMIEQKYLDIAKNEQDRCYNMVFEARGSFLSKEAKSKISKYNKTRVFTNETRNKISQAAKQRLSEPKNNPMYGKKHSNEVKNSISIKKYKSY